MRRSARNKSIPLTESDYLEKLLKEDLDSLYIRCYNLYNVGWTLRAIGEAFLPIRHRSTVRNWVSQGRLLHSIAPHSTPVPTPKYDTHPEGYQRQRPKSPGIDPDQAKELELLAEMAQKYRARMASYSPAAVANSELDFLVLDLYLSDVSIADLARAANVTHRAMSKRIKRLTER